ncbi:hypothetical protein JCM17380_12990 [Desulfosporosinus burensis]
MCSDEELLNALYLNDSDKTKTAKYLKTDRANLYRHLRKLKSRGLLDENFKLPDKEERIKACQLLALKEVGPKRTDVLGDCVIIYNILANEEGYSKEEIRQDRGYYEPGIDKFVNDVDLVIDFSERYIDDEGFIRELEVNNQWYSWVQGNSEESPYKEATLESILCTR